MFPKPERLPLVVGTAPTPGESRQIIAKAQASTNPQPLPVLARIRTRAMELSSTQQRHADVIRHYLQGDPWAEVFAASYIGLELAVACATTQLESGGLNIYGQDPASSWMSDLWEKPVTRTNYLGVRRGIDEGRPSNGIGRKQLTSPSLQLAADKRGGCWVDEHNCGEGDAFFLALINQTGSLWAAAYHYNGAGAAAQDYANRFLGIVGTWRQRLA